MGDMKKTKVCIGIPAYNEEMNIGYLLQNLLRQQADDFVLDEIIVSSDGSDDRTTEIVKSFNNNKIKIIDNKEREGTGFRQNQIFKFANADILVLLNADISIEDMFVLKKLIKPVLSEDADLTSCLIKELAAKNFFEKALSVGMDIKTRIFGTYKGGDNVYTCHGPVRAFSKRLYKKINFKNSIGEDAFSYLFCLYHGYKYVYVKDAEVFYKLPSHILDHQKQSQRFLYSKKIMANIFGEDFISLYYHIPLTNFLEAFLYYFIKNPLFTLVYVLIVTFLRIKCLFLKDPKDAWDISLSSKNLNLDKL